MKSSLADIDAKMSKDGQISISGIDNDYCNVTVDTGECQLTSVKVRMNLLKEDHCRHNHC